MGSRRKFRRALAKKPAAPFVEQQAHITLQNPVANQFESFVVANAFALETRMHDALIAANHDAALALEPYEGLAGMVAAMKLGDDTRPHITIVNAFREACARYVTPSHVVQPDTHVGQSVVICGAGPSLADHAALCNDADQVWGCNSALPWLIEHGYKATHGFTVDQTPAMVNEWETAPDVEYLVPSTVHPHLTEYLTAKGRRTTWFHNYCGIKGPPQTWPMPDGQLYTAEYEDWLYFLLYPSTFRAGSGLNTVTRAIDVATFMGFSKITVLGADCALRVTAPKPDAPMGSPAYTRWLTEHTVMHANGDHALAHGATAVTMEGEIDGRVWVSKPDLLISAVWLEKMRRNMPDRLFFVGDTLPVALREKSNTFLMRMPNLVDSNGDAIMVPDLTEDAA